MVAPYGFGVGDFIAISTIVWRVYKSTKGAPEAFQNIHLEVLSLKAVVEEVEETIFKAPSKSQKQARLETITDGCTSVLADLEALVIKYNGLGTQSKRTWDRMRWGNEDIAELRARLNSNVAMLTALVR